MELRQVFHNLPIIDIVGDRSGQVRQIAYDSRSCVPGSLFVAVSGLVHDGHDFIDDAVKRGAGFVIHEKDIAVPRGITAVRVADSRLALALAAKNFYRDPSSDLVILGVTGTNGKTTVTYLLEAVLRAAGYKTGVVGTVNYRFGDIAVASANTTPESLDLQRILRTMADEGVTHVIMEVSSHAIDLQRVAGVDFNAGVFTNLSAEHLDYHGTMENYYAVKRSFFQNSLKGKTVLVNGDDTWGRRLAYDVEGSVIFFGLSKSCHFRAVAPRITPRGMHFMVETPRSAFSVESPLTGAFNLSNVLAAVGAASALGIEDQDIAEGIKNMAAVPGRLERVSVGTEEDIHVYVDYAHTGEALRNVLETLGSFQKNRLITVFGCGGDRDRAKRPVMGRTATELSDCVVITSDNPRGEDPRKIIEDIERGVNGSRFCKTDAPGGIGPGEYRVIEDREEAIRWAVETALPGDIVLIAGKGHEIYQIMGDRRLPFDDRVVAGKALASRRTKNVT